MIRSAAAVGVVIVAREQVSRIDAGAAELAAVLERIVELRAGRDGAKRFLLREVIGAGRLVDVEAGREERVAAVVGLAGQNDVGEIEARRVVDEKIRRVAVGRAVLPADRRDQDRSGLGRTEQRRCVPCRSGLLGGLSSTHPARLELGLPMTCRNSRRVEGLVRNAPCTVEVT
ncbi:MAG TPA: hypothetical protein VMU01_04050, partial [Rhizomicrobium sp.]|nr:hypothetical protein [Rhizomicrobium sp.]